MVCKNECKNTTCGHLVSVIVGGLSLSLLTVYPCHYSGYLCHHSETSGKNLPKNVSFGPFKNITVILIDTVPRYYVESMDHCRL